jgi:hypothetical protein
MKAACLAQRIWGGALLFALGLFLVGCASHEPVGGESGGNKAEPTHLTGSYLKQNVTKNGEITNGKDNVRVLDRDKIDQSGAKDLNQFLQLQGVR